MDGVCYLYLGDQGILLKMNEGYINGEVDVLNFYDDSLQILKYENKCF